MPCKQIRNIDPAISHVTVLSHLLLNMPPFFGVRWGEWRDVVEVHKWIFRKFQAHLLSLYFVDGLAFTNILYGKPIYSFPFFLILGK